MYTILYNEGIRVTKYRGIRRGKYRFIGEEMSRGVLGAHICI